MAGLTLWVGAFLVPSRALAGCDNHAFLRPSPPDLVAFGSQQMTPEGRSHSPPARKLPCSGPNCSRGSEPGPLVPMFLSPSTGDHWLYVAAVEPPLEEHKGVGSRLTS
jgi:hypothetical protein